MSKIGPEYGTPEYQNQIKIIKMRLSDVKDMIFADKGAINHVLLMFILDHEYSRAAICQAEKEWKKEHSLV